ncbi:type II secretion system F family protein [Aneurinibacillus sp. REN35]|uniref:type II secretion system F family protein n=1 Tax=Aneurinibacillus sp. REN35 TaxID=3237286 RepID=UPI003526D954
MPFLISVLVFCLILLVALPLPKLARGESFRSNISLKTLKMNLPAGEKGRPLWTLWNAVRPFGLWLLSRSTINVQAPRHRQVLDMLARSGFLKRYTQEDFFAIKLVSAFVALLYFSLIALSKGSALFYYFAVAMPIGFYYLPDSFIKIAVRRRKEKMEKEMPMFLNTLAVMTDSGLNLTSALEQQTLQQEGILAAEFRQTLEEIRLGISQVEAFQRMSERCDVPDLSVFLSALVQGLEKGSSGLTRIIREQAQEIWTRRKQAAVTLGEKASLKLFFPMLLFVFPAMLIFLLGPALISIIRMLFTE